MNIPLGTRVKVVDDVGKTNSLFFGKLGTVIGYKSNKYRKSGTVPIVQLEDNQVVSGWGLWYEVIKPLTWRDVYPKLSVQQIKELLIESFGERNAKFHTLDEIPLKNLGRKNR
jgi:hypothetical protein